MISTVSQCWAQLGGSRGRSECPPLPRRARASTPPTRRKIKQTVPYRPTFPSAAFVFGFATKFWPFTRTLLMPSWSFLKSDT